MPKTLTTEPSRNTLSPALLALKPRQLLISRPVMAKESKALSLKSEQKALLLRSIAQYLERCGFSKCFKKLLSEAEIEKKELNSALPDLEEVYGVFLNKSNVKAVEVKDESGGGEEKKSGHVDENASDDQKKEAAEVKKEKKKKKKKKKKKVEVEVTKEEKVKETDGKIEDGLKEKKKKKKNKSKATEAETLGDEEKVSKKRKRPEPEEETKEQTEDDEDSKRRKKEENVAKGDMIVQETPVKQIEVKENGNVEKSETNKKSGKGLSNSKEPKKPFQRVNVEEVVFTDDRLKDNSYWAKDGADSGYGAKAQEVLGQVRGRGFRHEKTKKKRGSYRGGEIDLESHSVKFEYSDEE